MTNEELWQSVLARIQLNTSRNNFSAWFINTNIFSRTDKEVVVSVPNKIAKEWIQNKYHKDLLKALHELNFSVKDIKYQIVPASQIAQKEESQEEEYSNISANQLRFEQFNIDRETNLNPRYSFDNFIVGSFNDLTYAAAQAICKNPGTAYNPFFIYGGVGLGKTHLLQALGNKVSKDHANKKVKYLPSEILTSEIVNAITNNTIEDLKSQYKKYDVLIIDDIQFISGKTKTQEEFFNIFNFLYQKNKQIILSSDRPPKAIAALEERLRSRFEGGMIADIGMPDFETRVAILKKKAGERSVDLPPDVFEYIASNIQKNIRELEGALNKLIAHTKLTNQKIDIESAKNLLKNIISPNIKKKNPQKIIQIVADFYNLKEKDLFVNCRKKEIVKPRQVAMYLLRKELKNSFPYISKLFGGKDHTTAIYACKKIDLELKKGDSLSEEIEAIKQMICSC